MPLKTREGGEEEKSNDPLCSVQLETVKAVGESDIDICLDREEMELSISVWVMPAELIFDSFLFSEEKESL